MIRSSKLLSEYQKDYIKTELIMRPKPRLVRSSVPIHIFLARSGSGTGYQVPADIPKREVSAMYVISCPVMSRRKDKDGKYPLSSVLYGDMTPVGSAFTGLLDDGVRDSAHWFPHLVQERYPLLYESIASYPGRKVPLESAVYHRIYDEMIRLDYNELAHRSEGPIDLQYWMDDAQRAMVIDFWDEENDRFILTSKKT